MFNFTYESKTKNKENWIQKGNSAFEKLEKEGLKFINVYHKDFNEIIEYNNELQTSFMEAMLIESQKGKFVLEDTNVGISTDKGKSWKFINSGKDNNEIIHKRFPNLSDKIVINSKINKPLDEEKLKEKCIDYKNLELSSITEIGLKKLKVTLLEDEQKSISEDGSFYLEKIIRELKNPCKMDVVIKEIYNNPNTKFNIGDTIHIEITNFDNGNYYFISKKDKDGLIYSYKSTILKRL